MVGGAELQWEASIGGRVELQAMEACGGRAEQQAVDACSRRIPGPRAGSRRPPLFPLSSLSSIDWSCKGACPLLSFPASLFPLSIRTAGALHVGVYTVGARFPTRARDFPPARNPSAFPRAIPLFPCARRSPTPVSFRAHRLPLVWHPRERLGDAIDRKVVAGGTPRLGARLDALASPRRRHENHDL